MTKQLPSWLSIARPKQIEALKKFLGQACFGMLFKPGRGKTAVVYMGFKILKDKGFVNKALVICPIRPMYSVWPKQCKDYEEFADLKVRVLHGKDKEAELMADDADIYVINPEGLEWLFGAHVVKTGRGNKIELNHNRVQYIKNKFQMLVVDESTKFKAPQTNRFKLLRQIVKHFKRRYIMTGSPMPKGLEDLFGQIYILDEGHSLGSYISHYRKRWFHPTGFGGYDWEPNKGAYEEIIEAVKPLALVDNSTDGLPPLLINDIWIDLPPAARKLYDEMDDKMMTGDIVAANAAVASSKCRQICNGGLYASEEEKAGSYEIVHTEKIGALQDLLEQLAGNPVLITYEFGFDAAQLAKLGIPSISSGNARKDAETIEGFSAGLLPAVMGHPASIALGIDGLQKCCADICMIGCNWSFELYDQVILRIQRVGGAKSVTLHRILARDTVDQRVLRVLDLRDRGQHTFLEALKK